MTFPPLILLLCKNAITLLPLCTLAATLFHNKVLQAIAFAAADETSATCNAEWF